MLNPKRNHRPLCRQTAGEERIGIDRRVLSYDWHIPERRAAADRRLNGKNTQAAIMESGATGSHVAE